MYQFDIAIHFRYLIFNTFLFQAGQEISTQVAAFDSIGDKKLSTRLELVVDILRP